MATIILENNSKSINVADGSAIAEPCAQLGVPFDCEEGNCGTCTIEVLEGQENLSPQTVEEIDLLGEDYLEERLACQCRIMQGTVKISF